MRIESVLLAGMVLIQAGCATVNLKKGELWRTASVALVPQGNKEAVRLTCAGLEASGAVRRGGLYLREIEGETYLFRYLESDQITCNAWEKELAGLVEPLPEATRKGLLFEPMECLFYNAGVCGKTPVADVMRIAMFTGLKREKEAHYRLLHDNPWPDVVAAINKANLRHFSIFLEEINGKIYLFGWLEYIGKDFAADGEENRKDPASIRWWKETDACQIAPDDGGDGMWGGMEEVLFVE